MNYNEALKKASKFTADGICELITESFINLMAVQEIAYGKGWFEKLQPEELTDEISKFKKSFLKIVITALEEEIFLKDRGNTDEQK